MFSSWTLKSNSGFACSVCNPAMMATLDGPLLRGFSAILQFFLSFLKIVIDDHLVMYSYFGVVKFSPSSGQPFSECCPRLLWPVP